jgi:large subunit ribosomal protein L7/L12
MDNTEYARLRERLRVLEAQVAHLYGHLGVDAADVPPPTTELDPEVVQLINSGKKIHAIKLHRERTGLGLKEAHDAVEAFEKRYSLG